MTEAAFVNVTNGKSEMTRAGMTETAFVIIINVTNGMAGATKHYEWQLAVGLLISMAHQL